MDWETDVVANVNVDVNVLCVVACIDRYSRDDDVRHSNGTEPCRPQFPLVILRSRCLKNSRNAVKSL